MAFAGWIIGFIALFAGLALRQDMPAGGSTTLSSLLLILAILACPMIWRSKPLGISRGQRIMLGLALLFCAPILLLPVA